MEGMPHYLRIDDSGRDRVTRVDCKMSLSSERSLVGQHAHDFSAHELTPTLPGGPSTASSPFSPHGYLHGSSTLQPPLKAHFLVFRRRIVMMSLDAF